jgi:hypothetical protein
MKYDNTKGMFVIIASLGMSWLPTYAHAHCPLCTVGAGAAAAGAAWLGVKSMVIGILLGAFGLALGLWIGAMIKRQYVPSQHLLIGLFSWLTTVLPLQPNLNDYTSIYLSFVGDYGTLLNRTYLIDRFLIGSLIGAGIVMAAPYLSSLITQRREGKIFPYQGLFITFSLLLTVSLTGQLLF